jgi:uroporphyrinogen-III synthase
MRVLVTRPQPGAARTAQKLRDLGHQVVELPLTKVVGVAVDPDLVDRLTSNRPPSASPRGGAKALIAITSANAIRHAPAEILSTVRQLPCYAVGGETAAKARAGGFSDVREGPGSADGLAEQIIREAEPDAAIIYLCGRVRLSTFEKRLTEAGFAVVAVETYDTLPIAYPPAVLSPILDTEPIDVVLLYSAEAAEHFGTLAASETWSGDAIFLCLSPRVADRLARFDASRVKVAAMPTEKALLELL